MSDMENVANLLVETNKKLDKQLENEAKNDTIQSIVAQSLPEVLNERQLAGQRERFDKKEQINLIDDEIREQTESDKKNADNIVNAITGKNNEIVDNDKKTMGFFGRISTMILPKKDKEGKAGKKEEEDEKNSLSKKTFALLKIIGSGIGTLVKFATDKLKTAGKGILTFLSALGLGAFLVALGLFLQSDEWPKLIKTLKKWDKKLKEFGVGLGGIAAGLAAAAALVLFAPGSTALLFRLLGGAAFGALGAALTGLGKGLGNVVKGITGAAGKIPGVGAFVSGQKLGTIYSKTQRKTVNVGLSAAGNLVELGSDGKPTATRAKIDSVKFDKGGRKLADKGIKAGKAGQRGIPVPRGADGQKLTAAEMAKRLKKEAGENSRFAKFLLPVLRKAPLIMQTLAGVQLYNTWTSDDATMEDKKRATAGIIGGFAGAGIAATILTPFLTTLGAAGFFTGGAGWLGAAALAAAGGTAGWFAGEYYGTELANWLMGEPASVTPPEKYKPDESRINPEGGAPLKPQVMQNRRNVPFPKRKPPVPPRRIPPAFRPPPAPPVVPNAMPKVSPPPPMKTPSNIGPAPVGIDQKEWENSPALRDEIRKNGFIPNPQSSNTIIAPTNNVANTTFNGSGTTSLARNKYFGLNGPEAQGFFA